MMSLKERPGFLRLKGKESLGSKHRQSLVARRQQSFRYTSTACLEFEPECFQQMAGLICIYDTQNFYYLRISYDEEMGKCIGIITAQNNVYNQPVKDASVEGWNRVYLRAAADYDGLKFSYSKDEKNWIRIGPILDISTLSDEFCAEGRFTGAFVGLCCQDMSGNSKYADFDWFEYIERE